TAPYSWLVLEGKLPPGLNLTSNGQLLGMPGPNSHSVKPYMFKVQGDGFVGSRRYNYPVVISNGPTARTACRRCSSTADYARCSADEAGTSFVYAGILYSGRGDDRSGSYILNATTTTNLQPRHG